MTACFVSASSVEDTVNLELKVTKLASFEPEIVRFNTAVDDIHNQFSQDERVSQFVEEEHTAKRGREAF